MRGKKLLEVGSVIFYRDKGGIAAKLEPHTYIDPDKFSALRLDCACHYSYTRGPYGEYSREGCKAIDDKCWVGNCIKLTEKMKKPEHVIREELRKDIGGKIRHAKIQVAEQECKATRGKVYEDEEMVGEARHKIEEIKEELKLLKMLESKLDGVEFVYKPTPRIVGLKQ